MEARAQARYVRVTPMKARRVADLIRGLPVAEAQAVLRFARRRPASRWARCWTAPSQTPRTTSTSTRPHSWWARRTWTKGRR